MTTPATGTAHDPGPRNPGLDVVRAAAILLVLYSHASDWFVSAPLAVVHATYAGAVGVELFFALSGFLIGTILLRVRDAGLTPATLGRFWLRRWARTLPAYYVAIAALCAWFGAWDWPAFAFVQNFVPFTRWPPLSPHTWSLVLEEWFYLLFPLMLLPLARRRGAVPLLCAVLIAACTTAQALALHGLVPVSGDYNINPLFRLDAPAWGVLAACWARRRPLAPRPGLVLLLAGLAATAFQAWAFALAFDPPAALAWHFAAWQPAWAVLRVTATSLGLSLVVLGARALLRRPVPGLSTLAAPLAALSYALYLVHIPVIFLARLYLPATAEGWPGHATVAVLVLATALLLRHAVERPVLALRDRLLPDHPRAPAAAPPVAAPPVAPTPLRSADPARPAVP